nr:hypothetical protein [Streptomyces sp. 142MFCol3.1]
MLVRVVRAGIHVAEQPVRQPGEHDDAAYRGTRRCHVEIPSLPVAERLRVRKRTDSRRVDEVKSGRVHRYASGLPDAQCQYGRQGGSPGDVELALKPDQGTTVAARQGDPQMVRDLDRDRRRLSVHQV